MLIRNVFRLWSFMGAGSLMLLCACGGGGSSPTPSSPPVQPYLSLSAGTEIGDSLALGADGALWVTTSVTSGDVLPQIVGGGVTRITSAGAVSNEYAVAESSANVPSGAIVSGPDGAIWFATSGRTMGRLTTSGKVQFFPLPANAQVASMTGGPDGNVWFTDTGTHAIGRITPAGSVTEFPAAISGGVNTAGIAAGPDGALWFTSFQYAVMGSVPDTTVRVYGDAIGRITTSGTIATYPLPAANVLPAEITAGPDGALWLTEQRGNRIGRITTAGTIASYPLPAGFSLADSGGITRGPHGALWFVLNGVTQSAIIAQLGEITTAGVVTIDQQPNVYTALGSIAATASGTLWIGVNSLAGANGGFTGSSGVLAVTP